MTTSHIALPVAAFMAVFLWGCATTDSGKDAEIAVGADFATTGVSLARGLVEANPIWPLGFLRFPLIGWAEKQDCRTREDVLDAMSATSLTAATWNGVLVIAASPIAALAAAAITGGTLYKKAMDKGYTCTPELFFEPQDEEC